MPVSRYPVLVWEDRSDCYTAALVDFAQEDAPPWFSPRIAPAYGTNVKRLLDQLKKALLHLHEEGDIGEEYELLEPMLRMVSLRVRPVNETADHRMVPAIDTVPLKVECVLAQRPNGARVCAAPRFDLAFEYDPSVDVAELVRHYIHSRAREWSPEEAHRYMSLPRAWIETITVSTRPKPQTGRLWETDKLGSIADDMTGVFFHRRFERPAERGAAVAEIEAAIRGGTANLLVVGPPSSGKTTVIVEAIRRLCRSKDEELSFEQRFWFTSGMRIISGMQYLGEWQERLQEAIEELADMNGVLVCERLVDLVRLGGSSPPESIAAFIAPFLKERRGRLVVEATKEELLVCRRLVPSFVEHFRIVRVEAPSREEMLRTLAGRTKRIERDRKVDVQPEVGPLVYRLFDRFMPEGAFPGRAIAFLDSLSADAIETGAKKVSSADVFSHFVRETGLPEVVLRDDSALSRGDVEEALRQSVIGQDEGVRAMAEVVTLVKSGMVDPGRPCRVFFFVGPTGVGKTHLARSLASYLFGAGGDTKRMIRLDMSEYGGPDAVSRLLGDERGEPGELIRKMRSQPLAVILLDEIEKADPAVFDVTMGLLDEGRLTDPFGRVTDFRRSVIILTSNIGATSRPSVGFGDASRPSYAAELRAFFRPEMLNRIDRVVTFEPLPPDAARAIVRRELGDLEKREGIERAGLKIEWTDELVEHLYEEGFDERYGARPLKRAIETHVAPAMARYLLACPERRAGRPVRVDVREGRVVVGASG